MTIPEKQSGRDHTYDPSLKIVIAKEYLTTNLGFTKLARKYELPSEATVRHFLRWYRKKYPDGIVTDEKRDENQPKELFSKEVQVANLKVTALEMLIENASQELKIDLVKKFGTKQSKK